MKFLIQKIENKIVHDFSFTLLESVNYNNWFNQQNGSKINVKYLNCDYNGDFKFKNFHINYTPIGSVEFVSTYLNQFYGVKPKPMNIPEELFGFCHRKVFNGNYMDLEDLNGKYFIKSNDKIKGTTDIFDIKNDEIPVPVGNYQISELIDIESEWRAFVYQGKLVGLHNYSGDFKMFPYIEDIEYMISAFKSAPVTYTLDVGVHDERTFPIECHDFFSCGLYGFADHKTLPYMFYGWHHEYLKKIIK